MDAAAIPPQTLTDLLQSAATRYPGSPALDFMGRRWSYAEIDWLAARCAAGMHAMGVRPGDRIGLCLPNTPYFVIAYFAVLRLGGIVASINPLYTEREMAHLVADAGAKLIFVPDLPEIVEKAAALDTLQNIVICPIDRVLPPVKALAYRILKRKLRVTPPWPQSRMVAFDELTAHEDDCPAHRNRPDDVAVLQYTGGTTGLPKGAMLTHGSLIANCLQTAKHDSHCPDRREAVMGVLPMFHVFALTTVLNYSVYGAACIVLLPRFEMKPFLAAMRRTRPERLFVVPTITIALNDLPDAALPPMGQLRMCISGGAPLPPEVRARFEARTGCRMVEGYGLSEASPIVTCNPITGLVKDGSAGLAYPDTIIEIRSLDDGSPVESGSSGEVCVRGPQVMKGYWNRPEETAEVLSDGLLRTGDVGYLDSDGYLFLVDRIKDLILCGGYNVYPRMIEDALYEHPDVAEASVIGVPDQYRGEAPKAFVKLREGAETTAESLRGFLKDKLSKIEMPREIELRDELPKTLIGKLSKKELRAD
ncbi:long-chain-fatty-acid--CoA ligase [Stakelama tenebrarum]|uniref:Long-chain fatty acid--CoA ligase n=1 Tax=Stakelama tenebrarum TaxID=2711215 RepID=A0A6G6Y2G7_9SPHN|nr:long-chain fatty acid--CoA ligase [Sphingosinithalassobacter tenebrarum]QIG78766.1 long-chain fatty acid--CoA ligase [Sphingosinithalassobacter tenebrarum]